MSRAGKLADALGESRWGVGDHVSASVLSASVLRIPTAGTVLGVIRSVVPCTRSRCTAHTRYRVKWGGNYSGIYCACVLSDG